MTHRPARTAVITAVCAVVACAIGVGGWWTGQREVISRDAVRDYALDEHLKAAEFGFKRLSAVEEQQIENAVKMNGVSARVDNLDANVQTLIQSQERTNERLEKQSDRMDKQADAMNRLTDRLMEYLNRQRRGDGQ